MKANAMRHRLSGLLVFGFLVASCAPGDSEETRWEMAESGASDVVEPGPASVELGDDPCTDDCSGHEAGYQWAQDNGIEDPDDCGGNSNSFIEGCVTYAKEQIEGEDDGEDEADTDAEFDDE